MMNTCLSVSVENNYLEPFDDRIDILFRELELATKWQRPSVLLAVYSSEYVRADADIALENRLHNLGQSAYHIKIKNQEGADVSHQISELANLHNVVFFVEGLRWGAGQDNGFPYLTLNNRREFFIDNQIRVVFWLTEKEAIDLAHFAPDYWTFRHRVIEFVDTPKPDQISPNILESAWQWTGEFADTTEDLDAKIALRTALLTDLPTGNESTAARANLLLTLGILHWRRGDFERATQFLNTALDLAARVEDNCFEALCFNAIALVQTDLGRLEEAVQAYKNAIDLAPEQISAWNNLGHLYMKLGRHAEALAAFQKAIEQNESDAVSWNGLGDLYHKTGHNDDAIYAYLKAVEFSPDYAQSWCGLGNSHLDEGQLDDALVAHQKAIEIDRRTVNSWLGLGDIYRKQGDNDKASMAYRTALELDPKNALAWIELGNLFYGTGAFDEAMRSYQKSIEFNQGCFAAYGKLASIYSIKGLHTEAIPLLLKGLELSDDNSATAELWNRLGDTYRKLDDYDNATAAYRNADALSTKTVSPQTESPTPVREPQRSPSEDLSAESVSELDLDPTKEELLPSELSTQGEDEPLQYGSSTLVEEEPLLSESSTIDEDEPLQYESSTLTDQAPLPEETSTPAIVIANGDTNADDGAETNTTEPNEAFLKWLDGLASVLPVTSPSEMTGGDGSNPNLNETVEAIKAFEPEADKQENATDNSDTPLENDFSYSSESSTFDPESHFLSDMSFEVQPSVSPDQALESDLPAEEIDPAMTNDGEDSPPVGEMTIFDVPAFQAGRLNGEEASPAQVTIDEKNAQIWNELGNIYYNTGAFDEAMHAFQMAIELDPSFGWSFNNLASVYFHQKRYADAIPLYQKGLQLLDDSKDQALLLNRLGDTYRRVDKRKEAAAAYRKAMELDPDNVSLLSRARFSLLGNHRN